MFFRLILILVVLLAVGQRPSESWAFDLPRVAVINPFGPKDPSWSTTLGLMTKAARDLGMKLEVHHAGGDHGRMVSIARDILARPDPPGYLIYPNERDAGLRILGLAERAGVYSIMIMGGLSDADRALYGVPRGNYKLWIGEVLADHAQGGRLLAETLIELGAKRRLQDADTLGLHVLLSHRADPTAQRRRDGLRSLVAARPDAKLGWVGYPGWAYKSAVSEAEKAFAGWSGGRLYATESIHMAHAVISTLSERTRLVPGVDALVGSFGWSKQSVYATATGKLSAVVGGFFVSGAAAMVLAHDHAQGIDFGGLDTSFKLRHGVVTSKNASQVALLMDPKNWSRINFREFSQSYRPTNNGYDFSIVTFMKPILAGG